MSEEIREEGRAQGQALSLLLVLGARGVALGGEHRRRITTCTDSHQLDQWLRRAATATTSEDVFAPAP
ncbi:hypothetical protein [Streptomyces sp. NPDC002530]